MGITKFAVKLAVPLPKLEAYDRYLFIGPHPDDIEIGAGATAAKLASAGKQIVFLICADGRYGDGFLPKGTSPEEVVSIRRSEAIKSAETLGVSDVRFLELSDGGFYSSAELENRMAKVIGDFKPQVIFAPDPRVKSECHSDHLNIGNAALKLAYYAPYHGIMEQYGAESAPIEAIALYMTDDVNTTVNTSGFYETQQKAIFDCHRSQFTPNGSETSSLKLYLKLRSIDYGIRRLCRSAEGFRVLGPTHMHCLPESR